MHVLNNCLIQLLVYILVCRQQAWMKNVVKAIAGNMAVCTSLLRETKHIKSKSLEGMGGVYV